MNVNVPAFGELDLRDVSDRITGNICDLIDNARSDRSKYKFQSFAYVNTWTWYLIRKLFCSKSRMFEKMTQIQFILSARYGGICQMAYHEKSE